LYYCIAQCCKFSDGEFLKAAFFATSSSLLEDFPNRNKIIKVITELPINRNSVKKTVTHDPSCMTSASDGLGLNGSVRRFLDENNNVP
jgi:hypothetical protein